MFAAMQKGKRVFVTGGTGFLGAFCLYELKKAGFEVHALKRESSSTTWVKRFFEDKNKVSQVAYSSESIQWIVGELWDPSSVYKGMEDCDYVLHLSSTSLLSVGFASEGAAEKNAVDGTATLINAAVENEIKHFIHLGSVLSLLNPQKKKQVNEEFQDSTFFKFERRYPERLYRAEMEVWRGSGEGIPATVINGGIPIARGMEQHPALGLMAKKKYRQALGFDENMTWVDAEDLAQLLVLQIGNDKCFGQRYIVANGLVNSEEKNNSWRGNDKLKKALADSVSLIAEKDDRSSGDFLSALWKKEIREPAFYATEKATKELEFTPKPLSELWQEVEAYFNA